jgi:hypothetical protein
MKTCKIFLSLATAFAVLFSVGKTHAQSTYKIVFAFGGSNGLFPSSKLIFDASGNIFGTTEDGGDMDSGCSLYQGCGVVFELSPSGHGGWRDTSLFRFSTSATGALPWGALVLSSSGGVIGTTPNGGNSKHCAGAVSGCGVVYQLTPSTGHWSQKVLQYLNSFANGGIPDGLISDSAGNLYGIADVGANRGCNGGGCGTIFRLSPTSSGGWQETVLYTFTGGSDGGAPFGGLTLDTAGNLYGATLAGGNLLTGCLTSAGPGCGVIFKLSPTSSGPWDESVLYTFSSAADGAYPNGDLAFDSAGNLYGTTAGGGSANSICYYYGLCGVVFQLSPSASGPWTQTVIHSFTGGADGANPTAGVIVDSSSNVYGATASGGDTVSATCSTINGCGVVFKIAPTSGGWDNTVLHTFHGGDGACPSQPLTFDSSGNLFGTASCFSGVVFQIKP